MVASFEIQIDRAQVAQANLRLGDAETDRRLRGAMNESLAFLRGLVTANTPVDRGFLSGGIFTEIHGVSADMVGRVAPSPATKEYAYVQEFGRQPGSRLPPMDAIVAWVHRKGLAGGGRGAGRRSAEEVIGRAIAFSIAKKGTPAHHMFERAWRTGAPTVVAIFQRWLGMP